MQPKLKHSPANDIDIEVIERRDMPGVWSVEIFDYDDEGSAYVNIFHGPRSRERAEEYAEWKRNQKATSAAI